MKRLLIAISALAFATDASAQLSLDAASYTSIFAGSIDTLNAVSVSSVPAITTGASQTWDFSSVTDSGTAIYLHHVSFPLSISGAQFVDTIPDSTGFAPYRFMRQMERGIQSAGLISYGFHTAYQHFDMSAFTGGPSDTFAISEQDVVYSRPLRHLAFPATYGTTWSDTFKAVIHGNVTIPGMSYLNAPLSFSRPYIVFDTVVGWGTAKVKNSSGVAVDVAVLQVKYSMQMTDSTLINGIEITESQKDYTEFAGWYPVYQTGYLYYARNQVTPLVDLTTTYSKQVTAAKVLRNHVPSVGIANVYHEADVQLYPNPVTDRNLYVAVPGNATSWHYEMLNSLGQEMMHGDLQAGYQKNKIELAHQLTAGSYYMRISCGNDVVTTRSLVLQ